MSYDVFLPELTPEQRAARLRALECDVAEMQFTTNMLTTLQGMTCKARSISTAFIENRKLNSAQRTTLKLLSARMARLSARVRSRCDVSDYTQQQVLHALSELHVRVSQTLAVSAQH